MILKYKLRDSLTDHTLFRFVFFVTRNLKKVRNEIYL